MSDCSGNSLSCQQQQLIHESDYPLATNQMPMQVEDTSIEYVLAGGAPTEDEHGDAHGGLPGDVPPVDVHSAATQDPPVPADHRPEQETDIPAPAGPGLMPSHGKV